MIIVPPMAVPVPVPGDVLAEADDGVVLNWAGGPADGDALLVVTREGEARPAVVAEGVLASERLGTVTLMGTPTQRVLVLEALAALPEEFLGLGQVVCDAALASCRTRLALDSVAGLSQARPSLWQHLSSLLPWASFDIDLAAGTVTQARPVTWQVPAGAEAVWSGSESSGRLEVTVTGGQPRRFVASGRPHGARHWAELTVAPPPGAVVSSVLARMGSVACASCGRHVPRAGCPFCRTSPAVALPAPARLSARALEESLV